MEKNNSCPTLIYLYTVNVNVGPMQNCFTHQFSAMLLHYTSHFSRKSEKKVHCYRTLFQASLITAPSVTNYPCSTKTLYKLGVASDTKAEKFSPVKWVLICTSLTFIRYAFKLSTLRNEVSLSTWLCCSCVVWYTGSFICDMHCEDSVTCVFLSWVTVLLIVNVTQGDVIVVV